MEPEQIKLSQCEPERLKVLHEIEQGYLTQTEAGEPAPQPGDPLHWDNFVRRLCDLYTQRWGKP